MSEVKESVPISTTQSPVAIPSEPDLLEVTTQEINDVIVLTSQLSADELVTNEDIVRTEALIAAGKDDEGSNYTSYNVWDILIKGLINLVLPFINGLMLGFGEILAHEIGFKYGWTGARVQPARRMTPKTIEPLLEVGVNDVPRRSKRDSQFL